MSNMCKLMNTCCHSTGSFVTAVCCFLFIILLGSKSLYCNYFLGSWRGFFAYNSPNLNESGRNSEYKWGDTVRTHTKMWEIATEVSPNDAKTMFSFIFCYQCSAAFRPLILHWFWPFLKQKMWIDVCMHTLKKNCWISVQGVFQVPKTAKNG